MRRASIKSSRLSRQRNCLIDDDIMRLSRRMRKQGPPPPLDESKITMLKKRKAAEAEETESKRRKAESKKDAKKAKSNANGVAAAGTGKKLNGAVAAKKESAKTKSKKQTLIESESEDESESWDSDSDADTGKKKKSNGAANAKKQSTKTKSKKQMLIESESEDDAESWGNGSGSDAEGLDDLMADEFDDLDGVSDGSDHSGLEQSGDEDDEQSFSEGSMLDSDEEEERPKKAMFSDDEDSSDAEEQLTRANIEGLSRKLDEQKKKEEEEARLEMQESAMQTNIAGDHPDVFASLEGEGTVTPGVAPNMQLLRTRITDTIRILSDLPKLGRPDKSRADYLQLLLEDICSYYGYNQFLAEKLMNLFSPMEAFAFFEANETPRPVVIRTNTLRTNRRTLAQALINRGVVLEPVGKWSKVGLQVFESPVPLGATPEYLAGHYILQAASSFLPVMALAPQPHERILDMAAAPGGKTTYISALMRNTGIVIANDASKVRAKGLIGNIHRLGVKNTIVSNLDAHEAFPKIMGGFDRVLLDAPCTGTGVISKDPKVKTSKTERDFLAIPHKQKQLLLAAIDSTNHHSKTGGYIVYSTCSVTVEENEQVIQYALNKRPNVRIVDTGLGDFGSEGFTSFMGKKFDERMRLARRYYPHRENVDGFFVCKLKKTGPSPNQTSKKQADAPDGAAAADGEEEVIDKTPITDEKGNVVGEPEFGPFDDEADAEIIARGERRRIRRRGFDPKVVLNKPKKGEKKEKAEESKEGQSKGEESKEKKS